MKLKRDFTEQEDIFWQEADGECWIDADEDEVYWRDDSLPEAESTPNLGDILADITAYRVLIGPNINLPLVAAILIVAVVPQLAVVVYFTVAFGHRRFELVRATHDDREVHLINKREF